MMTNLRCLLLAGGLALAGLTARPPDLAAQEATSAAAPTPPADASADPEPGAPPPNAPEAAPPVDSPEPPPPPAPGDGAEPPPVDTPPAAPAAAPAYGGAAGLQKVLNPDISVIGNFVGVAGKSPGSGEPSLELREAEAGFQSIVDPYARADFFLTFSGEEVGVEEGYVTFMALPGSLLMKVGKMRDAFGKVDAMHSHTLPTVDRPLVNQNLLGGEDGLADSGVSISRLVPIPGVFMEVTGQVYQGESEVFHAPTRGDLAYVGHLRLYQDVSESSNVDLGGSLAYGHNGDGQDTTTRLIGADATFRYKPLRRAIYTHVLARAEAVWSRREAAEAPTQDAFGAYGYLEYQFARRWYAGLRYDYADHAEDATLHDRGGSFILTYRPSEFSQVRGQYRHTRFGGGPTANEVLFQAQFAIGAHGAHPF